MLAVLLQLVTSSCRRLCTHTHCVVVHYRSLFGIFIRAEECLSLDEIGQTVSLRGRIVDRMHVEPRFASERTGQTYTTHRGTWLGIPGNDFFFKWKSLIK